MPLHKPRLKLKNVLRGIVPTFTGFSDINPTNLAYATDANITTSTGEAKKILAGSGDLGYFNFDLGMDRMVLFGGLVGMRSSAGTQTVYVYIDPAAGNFTTYSNNSHASTNVAEQIAYLLPKLGFGRYLRIRFTGSAAGDYYTKLYEAYAYEVVI